MTACNEDPQERAHAPKFSTMLIKFKKTEYKEHIMVYSSYCSTDFTWLCTDEIACPDSVIHLCGQSPYIELPDDYLLIDWKWGRLYYSCCEAIIHDKWTDLKAIDTRWSLDEIYIDHPVLEAYFIPVSTIKAYNNNYLEHDNLHWPRLASKNWSLYSAEEHDYLLTGQMPLYDNAFKEYATVLSNMINAGDLPDSCKVKLNKKW